MVPPAARALCCFKNNGFLILGLVMNNCHSLIEMVSIQIHRPAAPSATARDHCYYLLTWEITLWAWRNAINECVSALNNIVQYGDIHAVNWREISIIILSCVGHHPCVAAQWGDCTYEWKLLQINRPLTPMLTLALMPNKCQTSIIVGFFFPTSIPEPSNTYRP